MRIGPISKLFSPGYGWCLRCRTTWRFVVGHTTMYSPSSGLFPLCEKCWAELTPEKRLPFYEQLLARWAEEEPSLHRLRMESPEGTEFLVRQAVMSGL